MIRIKATGHINNQFVDNDPAADPPVSGTIVDALWLNSTQEEICNIIEGAGLSVDQSGATQNQLRQALDILYAAKNGDSLETFLVADAVLDQHAVSKSQFDERTLGINQERWSVGDIKASLNYAAASAANPWKCMSDPDETLDEAVYPDYVAWARNSQIVYNKGRAATEKSDFSVISGSIVNGKLSLTLANAAAENWLMAAISNTYDYRRSFIDWWVINLPAAIGSIPAGEYPVSGFNETGRIITAPTTAPDASGAWTGVVQIYPYRVPGVTTQARRYRADGLALMSAGADGVAAGAYGLDQIGPHAHSYTFKKGNKWIGSGGYSAGWWKSNSNRTSNPVTGRRGNTTRPTHLGVFFNMFMGRII